MHSKNPFYLFAAIALLLPQSGFTAKPTLENKDILKRIQKDLKTRKKVSFESLLGNWNHQYGSRAVPPLSTIAQDKNQRDPDRYIAIMGLAKLGGPPVTPTLVRLLKDRSWMVRSGSLVALRAIENSASIGNILPLLRDRALVVRNEAAITLGALGRKTNQKEKIRKALFAALQNGSNYHHGKAQWVPFSALRSLVLLDEKSGKSKVTTKKLLPLLSQKDDPVFLEETIKTIEALAQAFEKKAKTQTAGMNLDQKRGFWKKKLRSLH